PCQRRTGEEDSARRVQALNVERRYLPRRASEEHHRTQRLDRRQRSIERVLADSVVRDIDALTAGELPDLRRDVNALAVEEHVVGTGLPGQLRLLFGAHRRDDIAAQVLDDLREQQTDTARSGMHERRLTRLDLVRTR